MKKKIFTALGLMSGTSMDGVDLSIIKSDGYDYFITVLDDYTKYDGQLYKDLTLIRDKIHNQKDLIKFKNEIDKLERKITIFQAQIVNKIIEKSNLDLDLIGFHGQTIYHNASEKISKQLGDGFLLSQLTKKKVVYDFRKKDLENGGQGAPLTPIFHKMLQKKFSLKEVLFVNIGGIINSTNISEKGNLVASDHGPGMCLIDDWIRKNTKKRFDLNGEIAKSGKINKLILDQALDNFFYNDAYINNNKKSKNINYSFDIKDFNISFIKGLSLEDGAATLIALTSQIIKDVIRSITNSQKEINIYLCGGGRKNKFLIEILKKEYQKINFVDDLGLDGDFIEAQAFGYLAIRSILNLPISFPETTGCKKNSSGGVVVKNF